MAIFRMGTVVVEAGSREVQGFDTSWLLSEVKGGILFFGNADGVIETVEADDRLTLALPWPGRSGRGQYAIAMSTAQAASAVPAFERLNDILNAFRGLSMLGRQVVSAATAEQMRRLLGVGTGNLKIDAAGTFAQRLAHDAQPAGFTYLATDRSAVYVRVGASGWAGPFALASGKDGREIQISQAGGYIVWRYVGETSWRNVVSLDALRGADGNDGLSAELRREGDFIQWRVEGGAWQDLVALDLIRGDAAESTVASIEAAARSEASAVRSREDADRGEELRVANEAISAGIEEDGVKARAAADGAAASQLASKASEDEAKASEIASKASEISAKDSELAAGASEIAAKDSETKAKASEVASAESEVASKESETRSKASEIAATASEGNTAFFRDQAVAAARAVDEVAEQVNAAKLASDNNAAVALGAATNAGDSANRSEVSSLTAESHRRAAEAAQSAAQGSEAAAKESEDASEASATASAGSASASAASAADALASEQGAARSADRSAQEADRSDAGADRSIAAADRAEAADSSLHSLRRDNPHEVRIAQLYPMELVGLDVPLKGYRGEYCGKLFVFNGVNGFRFTQPASSGYGTLILAVEVVTVDGGLSEFSVTIQIDVGGGDPRVDFTPTSGAVPAVYVDGFDVVFVPDFGPLGYSAASVVIRSVTALDTLGYEMPDEELKNAVGQWGITRLQSPPSGLAQVPPTYVVPPQPVATLASVSEGTLSVVDGKALVGSEEVAGKGFVAGSVSDVIDLLSEHEARTDNPHGLTKAQVGLENVLNLSPTPMLAQGLIGIEPVDFQALLGDFAGWGLSREALDLNKGIRQVADFNALPYESGLWSADINSIPNGPGLSGVVMQLCRGNQRRTQTFYSDLSNRVMMRAFTSAGWTPWIPVTPERGSNANGDWVKFADGTMQCSIALIALTGGGSATINATWTFPTPFSVSPVVLFQPTNAPPVNTREHSQWITNLGTGSVSLNISMNASWPASSSVNAQAFATGRWY